MPLNIVDTKFRIGQLILDIGMPDLTKGLFEIIDIYFDGADYFGKQNIYYILMDLQGQLYVGPSESTDEFLILFSKESFNSFHTL